MGAYDLGLVSLRKLVGRVLEVHPLRQPLDVQIEPLVMCAHMSDSESCRTVLRRRVRATAAELPQPMRLPRSSAILHSKKPAARTARSSKDKIWDTNLRFEAVLPVSSRDKPLHRRLLRASEQSEDHAGSILGSRPRMGEFTTMPTRRAHTHSPVPRRAGSGGRRGGAGSTDPALGGVFQMSHHDDESSSDEEASLYEVNPLSPNPFE